MTPRRIKIALRATRRALVHSLARAFPRRNTDDAGAEPPFSAERTMGAFARYRNALIAVAVVGGVGTLLWKHPPVQSVSRGDVGVRTNQLTGGVTEWREGSVFVMPGLHQVRVLPLRDQQYRPGRVGNAVQLQSIEGLSIGVDIAVRWALDASRVAAVAKNLPENIDGEIVEPAVQGVIYKVFARYTVREIFSSKRAEIQQAIESELKPKLAADGLVLKSVQIGKVELPPDYKRGMEGLLAEELASEKMRYTLELKAKQVKETELEANADKLRREVAAEAAGRVQVIAAKAQEEAMKHVLPFKQRQIEQRQLEAEAEKQSRIRVSEGAAQARRIEAGGEADARKKLAEVEAWRLERVGKANAEQMGREGALVSRYPLLIQKTMADKLSDKVQVIIAAPPTDGGFIGSSLLGGSKHAAATAAAMKEEE
jgi:regulator of protease activity HflC (stomatin/prohibitin superfamily)